MSFNLDELSDFEASGTVVLKSTGNNGSGAGPGVATSTLSDPTVESPNQLRVVTSINEAGFAVYRHNIIGASFDLASMGPITSISFSMDVREPSAAAADAPIYLGFSQDGVDYLYTTNTGTNADIFEFRNADNSTFVNIAAIGMTENQFGSYPGQIVNEVDQTSQPDLSAAGAEIQFAIYTFSGSNGSSTRQTDFRNAELTVNYVPEPSVALFLLGGLSVLGFARRR
ncbi:MAG: PEP-CTERM sorting domain-containing protein [Verrucomicrobiales bacterium]